MQKYMANNCMSKLLILPQLWPEFQRVKIKWITSPTKNLFARMHKRSLDRRLRVHGLRYDDLLDGDRHLDIADALSRLPKDVVLARNQRLKRAVDLSAKHDLLPNDLQAMQTPYLHYLSPMINYVLKEKQERKALGALSLRSRTLP